MVEIHKPPVELQPSGERKYRSFAEDLPNRFKPTRCCLSISAYERAGSARKRSSAQGVGLCLKRYECRTLAA